MATSAPSNLIQVTSPEQFQSLLSADLERLAVLNFWAEWAKPCEKMNESVKVLAGKFPQVLFLNIEADTQEDLVDTFDVEEVPTFLLLKGHTLLARNSGSNAQLLLSLLEQHTKSNSTPSAAATTSTAIPINTPAPAPTAPTAPAPAPPAETEEQLEERCKSLMNKHKVVLFMKGNPSAPKCGFSRKTVGLLREKGVEFAWFDILSDQAVREGLKKLNDWPTFPQIILNGELIGGLDIFQESLENGEWDEMYGEEA